MKIRKPSYFERFKCTASACGDNCCIGWEIEIDGETAESYGKASGPLGDRLRRSIEWEEPHFILDRERCPFLNGENLCDIIQALGEHSLCEICREHPRFYDWFDGLTEAGVGLCCEAAGRLIFENDAPATFCLADVSTEQGVEGRQLNSKRQPGAETEGGEELLSALFEARDTAFAILQDRGRSIEARLSLFLCYAQELQDYIDFGEAGRIMKAALCYRDSSVRARLFEEFQVQNEIQMGKPGASQRNLEALREILEFYLRLEPIDGSWPEQIRRLLALTGGPGEARRLREAAGQFSLEYGVRDYEYEHLAVYFVYRYFMKCREDGDLVSKAGLAVLSFLIIRLLDLDLFLRKSGFSLEDRIGTAKAYSKEIEYCEENLEKLADACWEDEAFNRERLMGLLAAEEKSVKGVFCGN